MNKRLLLEMGVILGSYGVFLVLMYLMYKKFQAAMTDEAVKRIYRGGIEATRATNPN